MLFFSHSRFDFFSECPSKFHLFLPGRQPPAIAAHCCSRYPEPPSRTRRLSLRFRSDLSKSPPSLSVIPLSRVSDPRGPPASMETAARKHSLLRKVLVRVLLFGVLLLGVRFAYVITIADESYTLGDFCFFSIPDNLNLVTPGTGVAINRAVRSADSSAPPSGADLHTSKDCAPPV